MKKNDALYLYVFFFFFKVGFLHFCTDHIYIEEYVCMYTYIHTYQHLNNRDGYG